jgi:nucleoid-associated protein YgaU
VHLLEYRSEEHAATTRRAAAKPKPVQKYKVKHGDTLKSIAAKFLGNSNKWEVIAKANKGLRGWQIPRSFIGKTIKVPSK